MTVSVQRLLRFAIEQGASDLHLSAGDCPMLRIAGDLVRVDVPSLSPDEAHQLIFQVMNDLQRRTFQEHQEVDFAYALDDTVRFRVKPGRDQDFLDAHKTINADWPGLRHVNIIKTGAQAYCIIAEWNNVEALAAARPQMIATLDSFRDTLEDRGDDERARKDHCACREAWHRDLLLRILILTRLTARRRRVVSHDPDNPPGGHRG